MKKKVKYSLMGLVAASAIIIPVITVVSCAEITKNAATNTYFAFSTVDAFSGNATNSEINAIALGKNELNSKAINTVNNSNNLTSVTSWYYSDTGALNGITGTGAIGFQHNALNDNNGTKKSLNVPAWLQQNNISLIQQLFTSVLNYLVGPVSLTNYLGQKILEANGTSEGVLRMVLANGNFNTSSNQLGSGINTKNLYTNLTATNPNDKSDSINIHSFAWNLIHPTQSSNMQTTYYLYPTDIFYNVTNSNVQTSKNGNGITADWLSSTATGGGDNNSNYKSLLASYMPATPDENKNISSSLKDNGSSIDYNNQISVAEVKNISIVFEFYCSSADTHNYTTNQPINATQTQNPTSIDGVNYPEINGKQLNFNPFYEKYFVLNINPIYVSLQNIGVGLKQAQSYEKASSKLNAKNPEVDLQNYAALNYFDSLNVVNNELGNSNLAVQYNVVNKEMNKLICTHPAYHEQNNNYVKYYSSPAASWCFSNIPANNDLFSEKTISNLYEMQQVINSQALMFEKIASISINTTLSEMYPSDVIAYLNGPISYNE